PADRSRRSIVPVWAPLRSANTSEASVSGQPSTLSSSLIPTGTPPQGSDGSAVAAAARAPSGSRKDQAFSSDASMAARQASSSSAGERSPDRKASTREHASPVQGVSAMAGHPRG